MSDLAELITIAADNTASEVAISGTTLAVLLYALGKIENPNDWRDYRSEVIPQADIVTINDIVGNAYYEVMTQVTIPPQVYPMEFVINGFEGKTQIGGAMLVTQRSLCIAAHHAKIGTIAQNNTIGYLFFCKAGTYNFRAWGQTGPTFGIMSTDVDFGTTANAIDWYNATAQDSILKTWQQVVPTDGEHLLQLHVDTKRAAATNYDMSLSVIQGRSTSQGGY